MAWVFGHLKLSWVERPWPGVPFLESPGNFSGPWSRGKISNLMITELFYLHILKMKGGSLHTRGFRRVHFSVVIYKWTKNGFTARKVFGASEKRDPGQRGARNPLIPGPCFSGQRAVRLQSPTCPYKNFWKHDFFLGLQSLLLMFIALILAFCIGVFSVLLLEAFLLYKWWTLTGRDARKLYPQRTKVTNPEVGSFQFRTLIWLHCHQNTSVFILFTCRALNPVIFKTKREA